MITFFEIFYIGTEGNEEKEFGISTESMKQRFHLEISKAGAFHLHSPVS